MDQTMRLLLVSLCTFCGAARALGVLGEYPYVFAAVPLHAPVPVLRVLTRAPPPPGQRPAPSSRYSVVADSLRHFAEPPHPYAALDPLRHFSEPPRQYASEPSRPYAVGAPLRHFAEPPARQYGGTTMRHYAETDAEHETPQYTYARPSYYPPPPPPRPQYPASGDAEEVVLYAQGQRGEASGEAGGPVLYARLSPTGGYTYRRAPAASEHHPRTAAPASPQPPPPPALIKDKNPQYILKIHKHRIIKD